MLAVVPGLSVAGLGAGGGVVALRLGEGEELVAHVCVVTLSVQRGVDGAAELLGPAEACAGWWGGGFVVAVGAGDDDLEVGAPLALVGGFDLGDGDAPEGALEVGGRRGVGADVSVGVLAGVALDVDAESLAAAGLVAKRGTAKGVVVGQGVKTLHRMRISFALLHGS